MHLCARWIVSSSNQLEPAQAGMTIPGNNNVVMQDNTDRVDGFHNVFGHRYIGIGGSRVAGRVIMHQDNCAGILENSGITAISSTNCTV